MKQKFNIGAFAIIFDDQDCVLLCHRRDHNLWNLPGGSLEFNEAPWECVAREVREEVGLNVKVERIKDVIIEQNKTLVMKIQEGPSTKDLLREGKL